MIKFLKSDILPVLSKVQGLTGRATNISATNCVLIKAEGGEISISATDLDTGYFAIVPGEAEKDIEIALNSRKFFDIVKGLPGESFEITELSNRWYEITCNEQSVKFKIVGRDPDEMPQMHVAKAEYSMDGEALERMIQAVMHIQSEDPSDSRAHMNSALFEAKNGTFSIVSTDGSRLIVARRSDAGEFHHLVTKRGMAEVLKVLGPGNVNFGFDENKLVVKKDSETIVTRLMEGQFPAYDSVLTQEEAGRFEAETKIVADCFKRMSVMTDKDYKSAIFSFSSNELKIKMTNPQHGEAEETIAVDYEGDDFDVCFNLKLWLDALAAIKSDRILARLGGDRKPCIIQAKEGGDIVAAVMPMRL